MKKKLILMLIMLCPLIVYGQTCEFEKDTQTTQDRSFVCDATKSTVTTFKTNKEQVVLKNDVCEIKCTEEIVFSVDPIKKVLAGTSFNYPLYTSGERKCTAVYKYADYETKIRKLVSEYETLTGNAKTTKKNEIINYYDQRKACDEFTKSGSEKEKKYTYNADVELIIETSEKNVTVPYVFVEMGDYSSSIINEEINYAACNFDEATIKCKESDETLTAWQETARIYGKYTMKDIYLEKYTGETKTAYNDDTCNAGDRYFTSLTEISKPVSNDPTDKGYKLTLIANDLGNNLSNNKEWNLNVECHYELQNLMFPQNKPGQVVDENYEEYGGTAFQYRIIDLDDPFPGRAPGANWKGKVNIITDTANTITTMERFIITLDRSKIKTIREYNETHSYDSFNLNELEKSGFIEAHQNIIKRINSNK